jgi:hypothetical protein
MNNHDILNYETNSSETDSSKFKLEHIHSSGNYSIKVLFKNRPAASVGEPILRLTEDSYSKVYETPLYKIKNEAYAHVFGWMDYHSHNPNDSDKNKELWKEYYNKFKGKFEDFYKVTLSSVAEQEYKKGWDKNLDDRF